MHIEHGRFTSNAREQILSHGLHMTMINSFPGMQFPFPRRILAKSKIKSTKSRLWHARAAYTWTPVSRSAGSRNAIIPMINDT